MEEEKVIKKIVKCDSCNKMIVENTPEEMGWKKIGDNKYLCIWCIYGKK